MRMVHQIGRMKILIQEARGGRYLGADGNWTADVDDGKDFRLSVHAYAVAKRQRVGEFQVVSYFQDGDYVVRIGKRREPSGEMAFQ